MHTIKNSNKKFLPLKTDFYLTEMDIQTKLIIKKLKDAKNSVKTLLTKASAYQVHHKIHVN